MDNSQLVVGNKDCPLNTVVLILRQSTAIRDEWSTFARRLDVSNGQIKRIRQDLLLKMITFDDLLFELLEIWIGKNGSQATLANLLQVVEGHSGANNVAEKLRKKFGISTASVSGNTPEERGTDTVVIAPEELAHLQLDKINKNLRALVRMTELNPEVISMFQERGILSTSDIATLNAINNEQERTRKFYTMIQNRVGYYEVLVEAIDETNQTGIAALLKM